jgi:hypothetical protein
VPEPGEGLIQDSMIPKPKDSALSGLKALYTSRGTVLCIEKALIFQTLP